MNLTEKGGLEMVLNVLKFTGGFIAGFILGSVGLLAILLMWYELFY
jgi:hypothetical protein